MSDRCFICGYDNPNGLEEPHVVPGRFGGTDLPENLVTLCASCHQAVEKLYDGRFYERLRVSDPAGEDDPLELADGERVSEDEALDRKLPDTSPDVVFEEDES